MSQQGIGAGWKWDGVPAGCGVLAIRRQLDGRSYFIAASDMRQRVYDALRLLRAGKHHNPELQASWLASADWEIVAVELVRRPEFLGAFKQTWIERGNSFNRKNSIASCRAKRSERR